MDKIRSFMRFFRKYHFWFVIPVLLILGVVSWYTASSTMIEQFDEDKKAITNSFNQMQQVTGTPNHPNDKFHTAMQALIAKRMDDVAKAWAKKYEKQEKLLVWPEQLRRDAPRFVEKANKMRPIESVKMPEDDGYDPRVHELDTWMRETFRDFVVKDELPKLAEIIGSTWTVQEGDMPAYGVGGGGYGAATAGDESGYGGGVGTSGYGGGSGYPASGYGAGGGGYGGGSDGGYGGGYDDWGDEMGPPIVVQWSHEDQQRIQASRFDWSFLPTPPTTLQVLYAQEDLWVLESLMEIIKTTNGDARHRSQAAIKVIESIEIGRDVRGMRGKVEQVVSASGEDDGFGGGAMEMGMGGAMGGGYGDGYGGGGYGDGYGGGGYGADMGMGMGMGEDGGGGFFVDPADERYVDLNYEPILGEDLRTKAESTSAEDAFLAVAKRMPVRLRVNMDTRRITDLLVACANARLTLEVHQLRVDPPAKNDVVDMGMGMGGTGMMGMGGGYGGGGYGSSDGGAGGGGLGYNPAPGASGYGGMPGAMGGGYGGGSGYGSSGYGGDGGYGEGGFFEDEMPTEDYDRPVELFGIIYIFNKVDTSKLGLEPDATQDSGGQNAEPADDEVAAVPGATRG